MKRRGRRKQKQSLQIATFLKNLGTPQILIAAAIVVIVLIVLLIAIPFKKKASGEAVKTHHALYFTQEENAGLSYVDAESGKKKEMTDMLLYGKSMDVLAIERTAETHKGLVQANADGSRIFFPAEMKKTDNFKLYYRDVNKKDSPSVVLAADVSSYTINKDGSLVTYKLNDGVLYQHDLNERKQISDSVTSYYVSDDGKEVVYTTTERKAFWYSDGESSQIGKEISSINAFSGDGTKVYYTKDQNFYVKQQGKKAVKIDKDVNSICAVYDSGEVYYAKQSSKELALKDYIKKDKKTAEDVVNAIDAHQIEWNAYELFYYDGAKTKSIAKNVDYEDVKAANDRAVIMYSVCDMKNAEKVKSSTIKQTWLIDRAMTEVIESAKEYQVAVEGKKASVGQNNIETAYVAQNGNTIYFIANVEQNESGSSLVFGDLYKMSVSKDGAKKAKKYDEDVYVNDIGFVGAEGVYYYKKVQQVNTFFQGELFVNKESVSEKAKVGSAICYQATGSDAVYFFESWQYQKSMGTFQKYEDGKVATISGTAHSFCVTPAGEVLFIGKYNVDKFTGKLYIYEGDKTKKIDDNVVAIIGQNK